MATKPSKAPKAPKPPADKVKQGDADNLLLKLSKLPAGKRPSKARVTAVLGNMDLVKGEPADHALKRRGLKMS